mmetsp:Transcript_40210/g.78590  ORF Transcript_40210/g.78590 Transcript_40210/m.78590 type:complete len:93 (+) Transcript_40210:11-289(+)
MLILHLLLAQSTDVSNCTAHLVGLLGQHVHQANGQRLAVENAPPPCAGLRSNGTSQESANTHWEATRRPLQGTTQERGAVRPNQDAGIVDTL